MGTDYKDTLNLPKTAFPMKANLAKKEKELLEYWDKNQTYQKMQQKGSKKNYILHDGPPYANGHIHLGHTLNKVLKDMIVKYKTMQGYYSPYVPGWDCHGLPIEHQVDKIRGEIGNEKKDSENDDDFDSQGNNTDTGNLIAENVSQRAFHTLTHLFTVV